jgi:hypothetical protein
VSFDLHKDVLFHDGEGADFTDQNDVRGFLGARLFDQVIRAVAGNARGGAASQDPDLRTTVSAAPFLYALSGGAGYIVPGAGALQTTVRAGTILQQVGSPTGNEPSFLPYTMADGAFTLTHAAADPTNPRVDVIEVKLELVDDDSQMRSTMAPPPSLAISTTAITKKRRIKATFQIKQGTPAATPAYPSLSAGFAALGAVQVPAAHAAVFVAATHLRDLRVPVGVRSVDVFPADFAAPATGWTHTPAQSLGTHLQRFTLASTTDSTFGIPCPVPARARIVGLGLYGRFLATAAREVKLVRQQIVDGATQTTFPEQVALTELADVSGSMLGASSNAWKWVFVGMDTIESALASGPSPTRNAEGLGDGVWGNGLYAGPSHELLAVDNAPSDAFNRLVATVRCSTGGGENCAVVFARWFYADGLA